MKRIKSAVPVALAGIIWACLMVVSANAQGSDQATAFKLETLNSGLAAPPDRLDRSTPQAALESFFLAIGQADFARAAQMLDLDAIPEGEQASAGPRLAKELAEIIERKIPIDFEAIPDRPDAMETSGTSRQPMVGEPRKSLKLGTLELGPWPIAIRLNRVKVGEDEPVWVFSRQTVEHVDQLYDRYGPTALEQMLPMVLRMEAFGGLLWWEVIALPIVLALAAVVAALVYRAFSLLIARVPRDSVRDGLSRSRLPAVLLVTSLFLHTMVLGLFVFSAGVGAVLSVIFWFLVVVALVIAASRVLDTIIDYTSDRYLNTIDKPENSNDRDWYTNLSAAKRVGVLAVVVAGVAAAISSLNVFSSFGMSLLVSAGVATAVFGIAAQTMIGNLLASLQLAFAKPLRIGDAVYFEDHWAYVEQINYTYVQLRTWDMKRFIVPVKNFVSTSFENWTMADPMMTMPVLIKLDHRTDVDILREHFASIVADDPDWSQDAEPKVQVVGQDEDGMDVRFYCTADDPSAAWNLHCRVREKMLAFVRDHDGTDALPRLRVARVDAGGAAAAAPEGEPGAGGKEPPARAGG